MTSDQALKDVVVIGAGLAGSSMAHLLAMQGWDVLLLERDHFPRHKVCGEFLSPESQKSLKAMALYDAVAALDPSPVKHAKIVSRNGVSIQMSLPGCAWGVSRYALDAALATAAQQQGAEFKSGTTVRGYAQADGEYVVHIRDETGLSTVRTRAVIAACGRHTQAGLPPKTHARPSQPRYVGVKCHFDQVSMPAQVELFMFPGGYAGINPVEGGRVNVCLLASYTAFVQAGKRADAMITAAARWNHMLGQRLAGSRPLPETAAVVAPVDTNRPSAPWDDIACLGDTAVMIPPLCGDGMAMALRSAELCAPLAHEFLRGSLSLAMWADRYCKLWHTEFQRRLRFGRLLQKLLSAPLVSDLAVGVGRIVPHLASYLVQATRS
jgi:flavin-dependent dehydrogenase